MKDWQPAERLGSLIPLRENNWACHRARIIDERLVGFELGASPFFAGERMFCQLALCDLQTLCIEQFAPPRRPVTIPNDIGKILDDERVAHGDAANVLRLIRLFRQFDAPRADDELWRARWSGICKTKSLEHVDVPRYDHLDILGQQIADGLLLDGVDDLIAAGLLVQLHRVEWRVG